MTLIRTMTMALLAVLCASAIATPSALASVKKAQFSAAAGAKFKATAGETTLETVATATVKCSSVNSEGVVLTSTSATQTVSFKGCKSSIGLQCKGGNAGPVAAGELKVGGILIDVVWLTTSHETLGLLYKIPANYTFKCSETNDELRGAVVVPLKASQEGEAGKSTSFLFDLNSTGPGVQEQLKYVLTDEPGVVKEATLECNLAGEGFKQAAETGSEELVFTGGAVAFL